MATQTNKLPSVPKTHTITLVMTRETPCAKESEQCSTETFNGQSLKFPLEEFMVQSMVGFGPQSRAQGYLNMTRSQLM